MYMTSSLIVAALASCAIAQAQTPKGFTPTVNTKLDVVFNSTSVKTPGELLSKAATASAPKLALEDSAVKASDTYMFVMLDLDVPGEQGSTSRRVLLHALETGFKATQQKLSGAGTLLASTQKGPAAYISPGPPATDTIAHRYVQLLFKEPSALNVKAADFANTTGRFNFNIETFMTENKLGAPVAANFFMVDGRANSTAGNGNGGGNGNGRASATGGNGRATATGGNGRASATGTGGAPRSSKPAQFEGAAGIHEVSYGLLGALGGLAMFVL